MYNKIIEKYGRAENAKIQIWPEAVQLPSRDTGFYDTFIPLDLKDIEELKKQFSIIEVEEKYKLCNW